MGCAERPTVGHPAKPLKLLRRHVNFYEALTICVARGGRKSASACRRGDDGVVGASRGRGTVPLTVPAAFTASETLDVGIDLGSPVALAYEERRPFAFEGTVNEVTVELK